MMGIYDSLKDMTALAKEVNRIDLYDKLVELQAQVTTISNENRDLHEQVRLLEGQLRDKAALKFRDSAYYDDSGGGTHPGPFCPRCFADEHKVIPMLQRSAAHVCPKCNTADVGPKLTGGQVLTRPPRP